MNPIQAILFDYGMVLSAPPDPAAWQRMRQITGFDEEALHHGYWRFRHAYDRGELTGVAYWHEVAASAGSCFTGEQVARLIDADVDLWTQLNPPMLDWAQRLQRAGIRTGILSNIGDAMTEGLLRKFDWLSAFDHCTWSYALNLAKPELAIYYAAAEALATPPAQILFIDDKVENIEAAREAGMQAIQYRDHAGFEKEMETRGLDHLLLSSPTSP
ncbi:HAD family hydrolase [Edaphobacter aggregans]|uniref:HAD family hydrolase n=1 Tax=Edaphobacter aggregans TaxID=570835 RepID=UPI00055795B0|nr:HAD family phosphatase [Edaphobacter aggregans]